MKILETLKTLVALIVLLAIFGSLGSLAYQSLATAQVPVYHSQEMPVISAGVQPDFWLQQCIGIVFIVCVLLVTIGTLLYQNRDLWRR